MQLLFWISLFVLFYTYIGYGLLLFVYNSIFPKRKHLQEEELPAVTMLVPAYNEEAIIRKKIENCFALDYPADRLFFIFLTDGSTDRTPAILADYPQITHLHYPERKGKSAAINRAMAAVQTPLAVFTDANAMLDAQSIQKLARHFADERVGGVSGEKRISDTGHSAVGYGERLYWQYESLLKKANADFHTIVGAAGELFAIRTRLFSPLDENIILDDFVISAGICQKGYRFAYEEEARAYETSSTSMAEERKRKIRISAGCFQALMELKGLINPFRNARLTFQYISHRVLRWAICPVLLPLLFIVNAWLYLEEEDWFYTVFFWGQSVFYFFALIGWLFSPGKHLRVLLVPYYFSFMVVSQYAGFYRFMSRKQSVYWDRSSRKSFS